MKMKMKRVNNLSIHKMHKVSKKFKISKIKKTNLNKKNKKTKSYNLSGGSLKEARYLFITNYDKIRENLVKEIDIMKSKSIKPDNINNTLNLGESKSLLESTNINKLFDNIITYLKTEAEIYFATQETKEYIIILPTNFSKFVADFINNNIKWIFECYIESKFYYNSPETDNLLFANYKKFLELYVKLMFLNQNSRESYAVIRKIIKDKTERKDECVKMLENPDLNQDQIDGCKYIVTIFNTDTINLEANSEKIKNFSKINILKTFKSLQDLNSFIKYNEDNYIITNIQEILKNEILKKSVKENPNAHIDIILNTPNLYIYELKTYSGSMYYGSGSSWCTSKKSGISAYTGECAFKGHTSDDRKLYIIQAKDKTDNKNDAKPDNKNDDNLASYERQKSNHRYQIEIQHGIINEIKDNYNQEITDDQIIKNFGEDERLIKFFKKYRIHSRFTTNKYR